MTSHTDDPLTPQEHRIMKLVAQGEQDGQIAIVLDVSSQTVTHYIRSVRLKLGVRNKTAAAVQYYLRYDQPPRETEHESTVDLLTPQECRVIEFVAAGFNHSHIANKLGISSSAVKQYTIAICQKLDAPNRTAAAVEYYRQLGTSSHKKKTGGEDTD